MVKRKTQSVKETGMAKKHRYQLLIVFGVLQSNSTLSRLSSLAIISGGYLFRHFFEAD